MAILQALLANPVGFPGFRQLVLPILESIELLDTFKIVLEAIHNVHFFLGKMLMEMSQREVLLLASMVRFESLGFLGVTLPYMIVALLAH